MVDYDVIVVGAGNAALTASVSAREAGAERVLVLEKAPVELRGGNTHFSGALLRFAFDKNEDLLPLVPDVKETLPKFLEEIQPYPAEAFRRDLHRVTEGLTDPELSEILIGNSYQTVRWMHDQGIVMEPAVSLSAIEFGGEVKWPAGAVIRAVHEGVGLSKMWFEIAAQRGVEIRYESSARRLLQDASGDVSGVLVQDRDGLHEISAKSVVLGCGGFESNAEWRARYLGRPWDTAKVRGTQFNNGDGLRMAMEVGALPYGQWSGCHGTPIDADSPAYGDRELTDKTNRLSYPYSVLVNTRGQRFVDEGEDFQFFTYAKTGGAILSQPGGVAFQIFDAKTIPFLEPRYSTATKPVVAETLEDLVAQLPVDQEAFLDALHTYNDAAGEYEDFNPTVHDGVATNGLTPEKTNWAIRLDTPPYRAYSSTGGITFSFGGVRIDSQARVISTDWRPIGGLFACGEMVGGLFHHNYPGGSGLMSGAVFGRIAGRSAAER